MTVMKWNKRCIIGISNVKRQQGKIIFNVVIIFISIKKDLFCISGTTIRRTDMSQSVCEE